MLLLVNHNIKWIYTCSIEGYEPEYIFKSKSILTKKEKEMPYKTIGKTVYVKKVGKWKKKAITKSRAAAKKRVNLLRGVKRGWKPAAKKSKKK